MPAKKEDLKPGYLTTEFWITIVVTLCSLLWGANVLDPEAAGTANKIFGFVVAALSGLGYTVSRGLAKGGK